MIASNDSSGLHTEELKKMKYKGKCSYKEGGALAASNLRDSSEVMGALKSA